MSEANGTAAKTLTHFERGVRVRDALRKLGPDATLADVNVELATTGESPTTPATYRANYLKEFDRVPPDPRAGRVVAAAPTAAPGPPPEPAPPVTRPVDQIQSLLKFGLEVERIGGVEVARRWLNHLEQLGRSL